MKTDTAQKILEFIKKQDRVTPKEIINYIGFGAPAVFRQLKKLQKLNLIQKTGSSPRVFYHQSMTNKKVLTQKIFQWATKSDGEIPNNKDLYCPTRDIFQSRNERLLKELINLKINESLSYLLSAVVGEIGNNSFDHNFGNWPDLPGVYFEINLENRLLLLADRGQGIMTTLQKALPDISNDEEALKIAFEKIISGRTPEKRGNGLKFVKIIIEQNGLTLNFYSGSAFCTITKSIGINIKKSERRISGTIAIIEF